MAAGNRGSTARTVLWLFLAANVAIVAVMFLTGDPGKKNPLLAAGRLFGLGAALLMILQLVLVSRLPWLDRRIGMDRLTSWHRWVGLTLFWFVVLHPTFVLLGFSVYDHLPVTTEFTNLLAIVGTLVGIIAAALVVVVVALSVRFVRRRLSYEAWHAVHLVLYAAITLALIHQAVEGTSLRQSTLTTAYWWTLWTLALLAFITGRFVLPLRRNLRHRFRVVSVVPESENVVSVYVTGRDLDRLPARAGQFMIWRFPGYANWWRANPFSLSAAPTGDTLRLTAKAVGKSSASLREVPVGTRVFAEGPYGAFTAANRATDATLLIAGGIGVTPIRALLEELSGPIVVLYRVSHDRDAVLLDELRALADAKDAPLHVLSGRTGSGDPPWHPFAPDALRALVPDITDRDVYICGPVPMTNTVIAALHRLGVPRPQIHAERFSLA